MDDPRPKTPQREAIDRVRKLERQHVGTEVEGGTCTKILGFYHPVLLVEYGDGTWKHVAPPTG